MDSVTQIVSLGGFVDLALGAELLREGRISRTGDGPLADEADQGSPGSVVESDGGTHFDVRWV